MPGLSRTNVVQRAPPDDVGVLTWDASHDDPHGPPSGLSYSFLAPFAVAPLVARLVVHHTLFDGWCRGLPKLEEFLKEIGLNS